MYFIYILYFFISITKTYPHLHRYVIPSLYSRCIGELISGSVVQDNCRALHEQQTFSRAVPTEASIYFLGRQATYYY